MKIYSIQKLLSCINWAAFMSTILPRWLCGRRKIKEYERKRIKREKKFCMCCCCFNRDAMSSEIESIKNYLLLLYCMTCTRVYVVWIKVMTACENFFLLFFALRSAFLFNNFGISYNIINLHWTIIIGIFITNFLKI